MAEEVLGTGVRGISFQAARGSWWRRRGGSTLQVRPEGI